MRAIGAFLRLSRLKFLAGGLAGFALGATVAAFEHHPFSLGAYLQGQWMVTSFHLMTHYANDYFDLQADRAARRTPFSGGSGVLTAGELPPLVALRAAQLCAAAGAVAAGMFAASGNIPACSLGAVIAVLAWSYSAPPVRLLARGWGELCATLVVAVAVPLAGYAAQTGTLDRAAAGATLPAAAAMFAMMLSVEVPDAGSDAGAGKRNLVVRRGRAWARRMLLAAPWVMIGAALVAQLACGAPRELLPFEALAALAGAGFTRALAARVDPAYRRTLVPLAGVALFAAAVLAAIAAFAHAT